MQEVFGHTYENRLAGERALANQRGLQNPKNDCNG